MIWTPLVLCVLAAASPDAVIPTGPDVVTWADVIETRRPFLRENMVEPYRRLRADTPCFEEGLALLEAAAEWSARDIERVSGNTAFDRLMRRLDREEGCDDPLLRLTLMRYAVMKSPDRRTDALVGQLEKTREDLAASTYPVNHRAIALTELSRTHRKRGHVRDAEKIESDVVEAWTQVVSTGVYPADQRRLLVRELRAAIANDALSADAARNLCEQLAAVRHVDPWVLAMTQAAFHMRTAWDARGYGPSAANQEDAVKFVMGSELARRLLVSAHDMEPGYPEAAVRLMNVTTGLGGVNPDAPDTPEWFAHAVRAQVDWAPAYEYMLRDLAPRWGGDEKAMLEFGRSCADAGLDETTIDLFLVLAIFRAAEDREGSLGAILADDRELYTRANAVLDRLLARPDTEHDHDWYRVLGLLLAWSVEDWPRAAQMNDIGWPDDRGLTRRTAATAIVLEDVDIESSLRSSDDFDTNERLRAAQRSLDRQDFANAARLYAEVRDASPVTSLKIACSERAAVARVADDFKRGRWADLTAEHIRGWRALAGKWSNAPGVGLKGRPDEFGLELMHRVPFGRRLELELTYDMSEMTKYRNQTNLGVFVAVTPSPHSAYAMEFAQMILLYRREDTVVLRAPTGDEVTIETDIKPKGTVLIQVWDDAVVVRKGEEVIASGILPGEAPEGPHFLAVGGRYWYDNGPGYFADVRIRKLRRCPPELRKLLAGAEEKAKQ